MNTDVSGHPEALAIPESAADAWAEVYIDVAKKLDAEEQEARPPSPDGTPTSPRKPHGEVACPAT